MNIVLIGMSGSGKSTIGKTLSNTLNYKLYDTDNMITEKFNSSIEFIFEKYGEEFFRGLESEVIKEISNYEDVVISTGGGSILLKDNLCQLKSNGFLIYLKGSPKTLFNNLKKSSEVRPLIESPEDITTLLNKRQHIYEASADYILNIDNKSVSHITNTIIAKLNLD